MCCLLKITCCLLKIHMCAVYWRYTCVLSTEDNTCVLSTEDNTCVLSTEDNTCAVYWRYTCALFTEEWEHDTSLLFTKNYIFWIWHMCVDMVDNKAYFTSYFVMWMQQSRICILVVLQEKPFCVQISFVFYCF